MRLFTKTQINEILQNIDKYDEKDQLELLQLIEEYEAEQFKMRCQLNLIEFCKAMQPDYKVGAHHKHLARLLMEIEEGEKDRITVSIAPRHGKSQMTSIFFAAWFLGKNPTKQVMLVSHTTDLAVDFGRKVRNLIASAEYQRIFPGVQLAVDSKSAGRWNTSKGGVFYATGVGSSLAGRGADLLLIDDPHSEQDLLAGNFAAFETAYKWYTFGARTRLMPGGRVAVVACMTGDTQVLLPDGTTKDLRDIRAGDKVASYNGERLVAKTVLNWANQGSDRVYTIALNNGNLIRANARHPFLVIRDGVELWVRLQALMPGDGLVSLKGAQGLPSQRVQPDDVRFARTECSATEKQTGLGLSNHNQNLVVQKGARDTLDQKAPVGNVRPVYQGTSTTEKTQTPLIAHPGTGVSGKEKPVARKTAAPPPKQQDCANFTITSIIGRAAGGGRHHASLETHISSTDTASRLKTTKECGPNKEGSVRYAESRQTKTMYPKAGTEDSRSTTATIANASEHCCVTFATSWSDTGQTKNDYSEVLSTCELTQSKIESIELSGYEDVFDIEVEGTENFVANGVISHNTRWHKSDLIGRLIKDMTTSAESDQWEVVEFPAILNEDTPEEKALWPEFFDLEALKRTKASMPAFQWNAQYQQNPTGEGGALVRREDFRRWEKDSPPKCDYIIQAIDAAAELKQRSDYTSIATWGVFWNEDEGANNIILLNSVRDRFEFPELKTRALEEYRYWEPDVCLVEKKSSGTALYQEMRRAGIPVSECTPHRGTALNPNTKYARFQPLVDLIKGNLVWVPDTRWAEHLVEELCEFPYGDHDDCVDTTIMVLMRFRQGGFAALPSDQRDEDRAFRSRRGGYY
jgi:predicted phage terminase large subunit-like protein